MYAILKLDSLNFEVVSIVAKLANARYFSSSFIFFTLHFFCVFLPFSFNICKNASTFRCKLVIFSINEIIIVTCLVQVQLKCILFIFLASCSGGPIFAFFFFVASGSFRVSLTSRNLLHFFNIVVAFAFPRPIFLSRGSGTASFFSCSWLGCSTGVERPKHVV